MRLYMLLFLVFLQALIISQTNTIVKLGKFYGIQDKQTKKWILKPEYKSIEAFSNSKNENTYLLRGTAKESSYSNLINNTGKIITKYPIINVNNWNNLTGVLKIDYQLIKSDKILQFSELCYLDSGNQLVNYTYYDHLTNNMDAEKINNKWAIYLNGTKISTHLYDTVYYLKSDAIIVKKNNLFGLLNDSAEIIIEPIHKTLEYLYIKGYDIFLYGNEIKTLIINNKKITCQNANINDYAYFEKDSINCFAIKNNNKWGIIRLDGKMQFECIYDSLIINNEHILIKKQNKWGFISLDKKDICEPKYDELLYNTCLPTYYSLLEKINYNNTTYPKIQTCNNSSPLNIPYIVKVNDKVGIVNYLATEIIPVIYDSINVVTFDKELFADSLRYYCFDKNKVDIISSAGIKLNTRPVDERYIAISSYLTVISDKQNCDVYETTCKPRSDSENSLDLLSSGNSLEDYKFKKRKLKPTKNLKLIDYRTEKDLTEFDIEDISFNNSSLKNTSDFNDAIALDNDYECQRYQKTTLNSNYWDYTEMPNDSLAFIKRQSKWYLYNLKNMSIISPIHGVDSVKKINFEFYLAYLNKQFHLAKYNTKDTSNIFYDVIYPYNKTPYLSESYRKIHIVVKDAKYSLVTNMAHAQKKQIPLISKGKFNIYLPDSNKLLLSQFFDDVKFCMVNWPNEFSLTNKNSFVYTFKYTDEEIAHAFEYWLPYGIAVKTNNKWSLINPFNEKIREDNFDSITFDKSANWIGKRNGKTVKLIVTNSKIEIIN